MPMTVSNIIAEFDDFEYQMLDHCTVGLARVGRKDNKQVKVSFLTEDMPFDLRARLEQVGLVLWFKRDEYQATVKRLDSYADARYQHPATKDLLRLRTALNHCMKSGALDVTKEGGSGQTLLDAIEDFFGEVDDE